MKNTDVQTRRQFCLNACQAASLVAFSGALSAILQSCSSDDPFSSALRKFQTQFANNQLTITL